ncbi:HAD family hydrolase [Sphingobacterium sp. N143]|uniref:HAD family hydrolase n=1 Tax=Sphingobacterium sp. N143 TaxID=2746727 RepID=UPI00257642A3|nr:HAD family hydrolase [Sphingobacterium sp. N143]MDM1294920.1 HAD family hydrolase [Sphingobacterium sp. N143]
MMFPEEKKVYVFELDDVIFPKKDYLLQVYYLFANFIEFTETFPPQGDLVNFMKNHLENRGEELLFEHAQETFGFDMKYKENFERLHVNAVLPLRLHLFDHIVTLFTQLRSEGKCICILTKGNPLEQLNKVKFVEWAEFSDLIKIYFEDELVFRKIDPLEFLANEFDVTTAAIQFVD